MIVSKHKLIELGFEKKKYTHLHDPNVFFRMDVDDTVYEISEDLKFAQWCNLKSSFTLSDFETFNLEDKRQEAEFIDLVSEKCGVDIGE